MGIHDLVALLEIAVRQDLQLGAGIYYRFLS
jgi:hypothetical protein